MMRILIINLSQLIRMERPEEAMVDADKALECNKLSTKVIIGMNIKKENQKLPKLKC